ELLYGKLDYEGYYLLLKSLIEETTNGYDEIKLCDKDEFPTLLSICEMKNKNSLKILSKGSKNLSNTRKQVLVESELDMTRKEETPEMNTTSTAFEEKSIGNYTGWISTTEKGLSFARVTSVGKDRVKLEGLYVSSKKIDLSTACFVFRSHEIELDCSETLSTVKAVKEFVKDFMEGEFIFLKDSISQYKVESLQAILSGEALSSPKFREYKESIVRLTH